MLPSSSFVLKECMTYSVGFRAPSTRDLVTFFGDHVASTVTKADDFFQDPDLQRQENRGKSYSAAAQQCPLVFGARLPHYRRVLTTMTLSA